MGDENMGRRIIASEQMQTSDCACCWDAKCNPQSTPPSAEPKFGFKCNLQSTEFNCAVVVTHPQILMRIHKCLKNHTSKPKCLTIK